MFLCSSIKRFASIICKTFTLVVATGAISSVVLADNPAETINVDVNANRHAISPYIYGLNWADPATLSDLNIPINRNGGNANSNYNWVTDCTNRASDYFFASLGCGAGNGASVDQSIRDSNSVGVQTMITIPMMDWVAKLGPNRERLYSFSVAKYGAQQKTDLPYWPDMGNGVKPDGSPITNNDPNDAYTPNSSAMQQQWVQHIVDNFGLSSGNGVKFYVMDNEYGCWHSTHRDCNPVGVSINTIRDKLIDYGGKVKAVDPGALLCSPESYGWTDYFHSGYDMWYVSKNGWGYLPDRATHNGLDYIPALLDEMKKYEASSGKRMLDVLTVHYYGSRGESGGEVTPDMQLLRNESTRDFWDPNYTSQSWVGTQVKLIPRLKAWVNQYYPGTKIGITEYTFGPTDHINGATSQADILGIFGREGLDLATRWGNPSSGQPMYNAFKMYRNYDGNKSTFGDTSVSATVANPDNVAAFAAQRSSDDALTVMVICKYLANNTPITINIGNFMSGITAQAWQLTSANTINRLADVAVNNGAISFTAPSQSITLFVIPKGIKSGIAYKLIARHSGKAINASGGQTANGTQIVQWKYLGGSDQKWILTDTGSGQYKITSAQSGKCIEIKGSSKLNGAKVQLADYVGNANQKFTLKQMGGGYYRITPTHATNSCLDVDSNSTLDGSKIRLWGWSGGNNQQFAFEPF